MKTLYFAGSPYAQCRCTASRNYLIGGKYTDMAKSKIVTANEKIAEAVTEGYKKIEKGVVDSYKKIERGVVEGYTKIEDKFIEAYLTKDGETVEEAKTRLKEKK